jgi:hypothetical protein
VSHLQIAATLGALALLLIVLELVRRRRLLERYALVWLAVGAALVVLGAWRGLLTTVAEAVGIADPTNALFAVGLGFLLLIVLNLSVVVSRLTDQTKVLAQRAALLEQQIRVREEGTASAGRVSEDGASQTHEPAPPSGAG